jgi:hypothetical protein
VNVGTEPYEQIRSCCNAQPTEKHVIQTHPVSGSLRLKSEDDRRFAAAIGEWILKGMPPRADVSRNDHSRQNLLGCGVVLVLELKELVNSFPTIGERG